MCPAQTLSRWPDATTTSGADTRKAAWQSATSCAPAAASEWEGRMTIKPLTTRDRIHPFRRRRTAGAVASAPLTQSAPNWSPALTAFVTSPTP